MGVDEAARDSRSFIPPLGLDCGCVWCSRTPFWHTNQVTSRTVLTSVAGRMGNQVTRLACLKKARTSPFWVGDLANVKSALLDWIDDGSHESCQVVKSAWRAHVRREQASLLLLAVTKTSICSVSGSLDSAREQGVLLGDSRAWDRLLLETAGSGNLVLSLVMPFVPHRRLRGFDDRPSDPCGTSGTL